MSDLDAIAAARAALAAGSTVPQAGSELLGQAWSGRVSVDSAGAVVLSWQQDWRDTVLVSFGADDEPVSFTVTEAAALSSQQRVIDVGPGSAAQVLLRGAFVVSAAATGGNAFAKWAISRGTIPAEVPPVMFPSPALTAAGGPAPGPWVDMSATGGTPGNGYAPPFTPFCSLACSSDGEGIDFRLIDRAGTVFADWRQADGAPATFTHPPHLRLQARHPGDVANTRRAVAAWRRE